MAKHLEIELNRLKKQIYALSARVEESLEKAVKAVQEGDPEQAAILVREDVVIDEMEVEVEEECLKILALHQPVAIDLRFIVAILKMNSDLERIGDLAADIAKNALTLGKLPKPKVPLDLHQMGYLVRAIVHKSIDALVSVDAYRAREVLRDDDEIDAMKSEMKAEIRGALRQDPDHADALITLLAIVHRLERIGDHASNIAEDVIYMVEAEIVRHQDRP